MKKNLLKTIYNFGGFAPFHWLNREKILILMYHRFSRETNPFKISSAEFAAHLEYLAKHNRVLSLAETVALLKNGKTLPPNTTVITIDDGYADAFEIAFPLLKKFNLPATLFVVTDFANGKCWLWTDLMRYVLTATTRDFIKIEFEIGEKIEVELTNKNQRIELAAIINSRLKKMPDKEKDLKIKKIAADLAVEIPALPTAEYAPINWRQAQEMDASVLKIESHTATHPILTNINETRLDFELNSSRVNLETVLNRKSEHFCYPNGSLNETVWQAVKNNEYQSAVTTEYGFNGKEANPFLLKRIDAPAAIENFAQSVSGFEAFRKSSS
ncbi:MAG: polysaccharide deacetylase family protein [Pyrinomonadaceae bacterium]|nr:polysaccharide deacetylase family protein [Pyrinomonadaceae bacterium]